MIEQFKSINDLSEVIKEYEGMLSRPTMHKSHPTLYSKGDVGKNETIVKGIRVREWFLSEDEKWVMPHNQMGLSFSSTYKNLKAVYKLKSKHNPAEQINIFWVMEKADLPPGLKFEADSGKKGHYFLTVTEQMLFDALVKKLKVVAQRMSIIENVGNIL